MRTAYSVSHGALSAAVVVLAITAGVVQAGAQDAETVDLASPLARALLSCTEIEDRGSRLDCFDRVAEPLAQRAEQDETVFRGEGDWDSETLTFERPWRLVWSAEGSILTIELHDSVGQLDSIVGNQIGAGDGASDVLDPGTWQLAVRAVGAWEIRVVEDVEE